MLNGGPSGAGNGTLYARIVLAEPLTAVVLAKIALERIERGSFGTKMTMTIPPILNGDASLVRLRADFAKRTRVRGMSASLVSLSCPDGEVVARGLGRFAEGTESGVELRRTCTVARR